MDEKHANGFAACVQQGLRLGTHLRQVHRRVDRAIGQHALIDFQAKLTRHHRREAAAQAPGLRAIASAHFQHIAKAARGEDARFGHLAFQQGIGPHRRAMHDGGNGLGASADTRNAVHETARFLATRRGHFDNARTGRGLIEDKQIRERAADIHANHCLAAHAPSLPETGVTKPC